MLAQKKQAFEMPLARDVAGQATAALLQDSIDAIMERLAELKLSLRIETDFAKLRAYYAGEGAWFNATFDPGQAGIGPDDFWFRVQDQAGETIAVHADRVLHNANFMDIWRTGALWDRHAGRGQFRDDIRLFEPSRPIEGLLAHAGCLWVRKPWRGVGLSVYLVNLSRAILMRDHQVDYITGCIMQGLKGSPVPTAYYGYDHVDLCHEGYLPLSGKEERIYLCWATPEEALLKLAQLPQHPLHPIRPLRVLS